MQRIDPISRRDKYGSRINRRHSPFFVFLVPIASILLGSILPFFLIAGDYPIIPPLGYMMLLAWRFMRPELMPVWAGIPLGLFDDIFNAEPMGWSLMTWSLTLLVFYSLDDFFPWRGFIVNWVLGAVFAVLYISFGAIVANHGIDGELLIAIIPQMLLAILAFPLFSLLVARLDELRLTRFRVRRP